MVHRGAVIENFDQTQVDEHTIPVDNEKYIDINKQLTLHDVDEFFKSLLEFKDSEEFSPNGRRESSEIQMSLPLIIPQETQEGGAGIAEYNPKCEEN
jgi:hypothetical protein